MATPRPFPQAGFLMRLQALDDSTPRNADASLSPPLASVLWPPQGQGKPSAAVVAQLIHLLQTRKAMQQAAFDTQWVADELRRYQKFARPGRPSPHVVQLRQQQAAARQASSQSRQAFIQAAAAFVRDADIKVPQRVALELYVTRWIDANVPTDFVSAS
jgi:hypothetical protein